MVFKLGCRFGGVKTDAVFNRWTFLGFPKKETNGTFIEKNKKNKNIFISVSHIT